ncbi:serine proteinase inhibitor [Cooperia oncophora]
MFLTVETDFGLNLLQYAHANESLVVSPISVIFTLVMVQAGAKGVTKSQIDSVISEGASDNEIDEHYTRLSKQITNATNGVKIEIANAFFINQEFEIEKDYEQTIEERYNARVEAVNFDKAEEAAKIIDGFEGKTTEGKIRDMVNEGTVQGAHSLIINAIHFAAEWKYKFDKGSNSNGTFYSAAGNHKEVEYMNAFYVHRLYTQDDDFQVLCLQYSDPSFAFNIFLPRRSADLSEVRSSLTGEKIQSLLSDLEEAFMSVTIPKMKIETDFNLKSSLIPIGVSEMFSDEADLSGIIKEPSVKVSDVTHRATIEVDEDGTRAAAATLFKVPPVSAVMKESMEFQADHPFLFILTKDNNPLFMGQFL